MRVSTGQFYKVNAEQMSAGQSKVAELQAKLGAASRWLGQAKIPIRQISSLA